MSRMTSSLAWASLPLKTLATISWCSRMSASRPESSFAFFCFRFRCTEALRAVPRLVGQHVTKPRCSSRWYSRSAELRRIYVVALDSRSYTSIMFGPLCMDIMRRWSSSLTQISRVLSLLWNTPRPTGQSLLKLAACKKRSPCLLETKWWLSHWNRVNS